MMQRLFATTALVSLATALASPAYAAAFTISGSSTTAQTLGSGSGQTGTVNAGSSLTVSGSTVAVTISGNSATLTNLGTISQTGTGRVVRDNTGVTGLVINNGSATNSTATMQAADADVIQMNKSPASVTVNNYGTMNSLNASAGGSQAIDFNAIASGSNVVNNFSTGKLLATEADAVRPGVNGVVNNTGLIKSTTSTGSSSDGVDAQNNSGITINNGDNAVTGTGNGTIEGARHGITGGAVDAATSFVMSIVNKAGSVIRGDNGSGVNIDGFNASEVVTINNAGTITGNGVTGDGDGVDVDGIVNLTNTGTIKSINAVEPGGIGYSEGISVGGGTIVNSGTIQGSVATGNTNAVGRGITLAGNDVSGAPAGTREAIYADATITNQAGGLIQGDSDSAIYVGGPASGHTITINNNTGATIRGGGTVAAVQLGADNDIINNAGVIDGAISGKAINMGAGNDTLNLSTGSSITGSIDGGTGTDAINLSGTGTLGSTQNFETLKNNTSSTWTLTGTQSYVDGTNNGTLKVDHATASFTGTFTNNGLLQTDPTTMNFNNLTVALTGAISASTGDVFNVSGNFFNQSTQNTAWNTKGATLAFGGAVQTAHQMQLTGLDQGAFTVAAQNNFMWGTLDITGQSLSLLSGLTTGTAALYVGTLLGLDINFLTDAVLNIVGNGLNIYYDRLSNAALGGLTYALQGGGFLIAFDANGVPAPSALLLLAPGLLLLGRRRFTARRG